MNLPRFPQSYNLMSNPDISLPVLPDKRASQVDPSSFHVLITDEWVRNTRGYWVCEIWWCTANLQHTECEESQTTADNVATSQKELRGQSNNLKCK